MSVLVANVRGMQSTSTPDVYAERAYEAALEADAGPRAVAYALLAVASSIERLAEVHQDKE